MAILLDLLGTLRDSFSINKVPQPVVVYIGTWAGKPAASSYAVGSIAIITDIGLSGRSQYVTTGTRWVRDEALLIYSNGNLNASTTSATEVILGTIPVLGSTVGPNGKVEVDFFLTFTNSAATKIPRVRIGTSLAASQVVWVHNLSTSAKASVYKAGFRNRNSESAQLQTACDYNVGAGQATTALLPSTSIDTTADFNIYITGQTDGTAALELEAADATLSFAA